MRLANVQVFEIINNHCKFQWSKSQKFVFNFPFKRIRYIHPFSVFSNKKTSNFIKMIQKNISVKVL